MISKNHQCRNVYGQIGAVVMEVLGDDYHQRLTIVMGKVCLNKYSQNIFLTLFY